MTSSVRLLSATIAIALLAGCSMLWLDTYWRSEKYVLLAVDTPGQMSLSVDIGEGTALALVQPTVFAVGSDSRYIVIERHPATDGFGDFDRSVIEYFVVKRADGSTFERRLQGVQGPLRKSEFDRLANTLKLPAFSKTIKELE